MFLAANSFDPQRAREHARARTDRGEPEQRPTGVQRGWQRKLFLCARRLLNPPAFVSSLREQKEWKLLYDGRGRGQRQSRRCPPMFPKVMAQSVEKAVLWHHAAHCGGGGHKPTCTLPQEAGHTPPLHPPTRPRPRPPSRRSHSPFSRGGSSVHIFLIV